MPPTNHAPHIPAITTQAKGTKHPSLFFQTLTTDPAHWISDYHPSVGDCLLFRFQHTHEPSACVITSMEDDARGQSLTIQLEKPLRALNLGQYAVLYRGKECLGGARIVDNGQSEFERHCNNAKSIVTN